VACVVLGVAGGVVVLLLLARIVYRRWRRDILLVFDSASAPLKILLTFSQLSASLSTDWSAGSLSGLFVLLGLTNASTTGVGLECFFPSLGDPVVRFGVSLVTPLVVMALVSVAMVVIHFVVQFRARRAAATAAAAADAVGSVVAEHRDATLTDKAADQDDEQMLARDYGTAVKHYAQGSGLSGVLSQLTNDEPAYDPLLSERITRGILFSLYLFYFGIANSSMAVFNCVTATADSSYWYMQSLPWVECGSPVWLQLRLFSLVAIGVYVGGVPIVFGTLLFLYRHRRTEVGILYWLNTLSGSYRHECYSFEMVMILRRLLLAMLLALVDVRNPLRAVGIFTLLLLALLVQVNVRPFRAATENAAEQVSVALLVLLYASQIGWRAYALDPVAGAQALGATFLSYAAMVLTVGGLVTLTLLSVPHVVRRLRQPNTQTTLTDT
jgi:hypothetical protein